MSNKRRPEALGRNQSVRGKKKAAHQERLCVCCHHGRSRVCGKYNWAKNNYLFRSIRGRTFQLAGAIACPRKIILRKISLAGKMRVKTVHDTAPRGPIIHDHNSKCPTPTFATEH